MLGSVGALRASHAEQTACQRHFSCSVYGIISFLTMSMFTLILLAMIVSPDVAIGRSPCGLGKDLCKYFKVHMLLAFVYISSYMQLVCWYTEVRLEGCRHGF